MNRLRSVSRGAASRDGFILIVVLGILVLITILVVGFLVHAGSQAKSFASYRDQTSNLLLSDVAVNMVKAQVDDATGISSGASPGLWASQPGAIRTVDGSGQQKTYKLYSSRTPTDTNTGTTLGDALVKDLPAATAVASNDWANSPVWTDLNAPALKSDGTSAYPIIDVVNDNADLPAGTTGSAPFASGNFNVVSDPIVNPVGAVRSATGKYPLPMPVQWLYVLKQGQVIAPDTTGVAGAQVTFNKASTVPTADNPIVGRVAYWTDDDTCRVNVNTASVNANPIVNAGWQSLPRRAPSGTRRISRRRTTTIFPSINLTAWNFSVIPATLPPPLSRLHCPSLQSADFLRWVTAGPPRNSLASPLAMLSGGQWKARWQPLGLLPRLPFRADACTPPSGSFFSTHRQPRKDRGPLPPASPSHRWKQPSFS